LACEVFIQLFAAVDGRILDHHLPSCCFAWASHEQLRQVFGVVILFVVSLNMQSSFDLSWSARSPSGRELVTSQLDIKWLKDRQGGNRMGTDPPAPIERLTRALECCRDLANLLNIRVVSLIPSQVPPSPLLLTQSRLHIGFQESRGMPLNLDLSMITW